MDVTHESTDPGSRTMESWRASLAALRSRGEVDGPRVDDAEAGLSFWRCHKALFREVRRGYLTEEQALRVLDQLRRAAPPVAH